ncbi:c-type cytochrome [Pseudomonas sp. GCM10022186]|uniref:c-type cytochrome n=1 Tax=Pseudomonas sp. GCM10022186 TaxID=3252650 RepID=UPI00362089F8
MNKAAVLLGITLASMGNNSWALDTGKTVFEQRCAACHQVDGTGNEALKAPSLAGLSQSYVERQLNHFRNGLRGANSGDLEGQVMRGITASLKDDEISQLGQYIAQLPRRKVGKPAKQLSFAGRGLYSGCTSCHGAQAEGFDELGAPRLAGQHEWYLSAQLLKYRSGLRGAHPDDKYGQQMSVMAAGIRDDAAIEVLVRHIGSLATE